MRRTAVLLAHLALFGCGEPSPPTPVPTQVQLENLTDPRPRAYTRDAPMSFRATLSGGTPSAFALYRGAEKVTDLQTGVPVTVATLTLPEGVYEFSARAIVNGFVHASPIRTVEVDRTPPQLLPDPFGRYPRPGDQDVWVGDSIQLVFNEPIDPASVTPSTLRLTRGGATVPTAPPAVLPLGPGESAGLIISLVPSAPLPTDTTLAVELTGGVRDLAGNGVTLAGSPWTFRAPSWRLLGAAPLQAYPEPNTPASWPSVLIDKDKDPLVAWQERSASGETRAFVRSWSTARREWSVLGGALGPVETDPSVPAHALGLSDGDEPILVWRQPDPGGANLFANLWSGSGWLPMGSGISAAPGNTPTGPPSMSPYGSRPVLAFHEAPAPGAPTDVYVYQYDGAEWKAVADGIGRNVDPDLIGYSYPCVDLTHDGRPVVAYHNDSNRSIEVALLNKAVNPNKLEAVVPGSRLNADQSGTPASAARFCAIQAAGTSAVPSSALPWVSWGQGGAEVRLARATSTTAWSPGPAGTAAGAGTVGDLELDAGLAYVALQTGDDVVIRRFNGTAWDQVGPSFRSLVPGSTAAEPALATRNGEIAVAWVSIVDGVRSIRVAKLNRP